MTINKKTALILFASEQVWPNLLSIEWYNQNSNLTSIFIFHTNDHQKSAMPAQRIKKFCELQYPGLQCVLPETGLAMTPNIVVDKISAWYDENPDISSWIINATGGTKLIFAGAVNALMKYYTVDNMLKSWELVYRELGGWYRLSVDSSYMISAEKLDAHFIPKNILNNVPILNLIKTQFQSDEELIWNEGDKNLIKKIDDENLNTILSNGHAHNWRWADLFKLINIDVGRDGFTFELFLAAAIYALGIEVNQIAMNLTSKVRGSAKTQQEIDVMVNNDGRLYLFDCKLLDIDKEDKSSFINHVKASHDTAHMMGGLNAQCVIVRPNRVIDSEEESTANAWGITLLGWKECSQLFSSVGKIIGITPSKGLLYMESKLHDSRTLQPPFIELPVIKRIVAKDPHIIHLAGIYEHLAKMKGTPGIVWKAIEIANNIWVITDKMDKGMLDDITLSGSQIDNMFFPFSSEVKTFVSKNGIWLTICRINEADKFNAWLKSNGNKNHLL